MRLSHGGKGWISLGDQTIVLGEPEAHEALWAVIKETLTAEGDLLLYGCEIAADTASQTAVTQLAKMTGADIAASTNITGVDGDWTLEYRSGSVEAVDIAAPNWAGNLWLTEALQASWWSDDAGNRNLVTTAVPSSLTFSNMASAPGVALGFYQFGSATTFKISNVDSTSYAGSVAANEYIKTTFTIKPGLTNGYAVSKIKFRAYSSPATSQALASNYADGGIYIYDDGTGQYFPDNTTGATDPTAVLNDDRPSFSVNDVSVNESAGTMTFTVTLTGNNTRDASVNYAIGDVTTTGAADYSAGTSALSGTLNFAAGVTTRTVTINIVNDALHEPTDTLNIVLSGSTGATIEVGKDLAQAVVNNGAGAQVAGTAGVERCEREGFAVVGRAVVGNRHAHEQIGDFIGRGVAVGRYRHVAVGDVGSPGAAVPVFQRSGVVAACSGGASARQQLDVLALKAADSEDRIGRGFVDRDVVDRNHTFVVGQRAGRVQRGADHRVSGRVVGRQGGQDVVVRFGLGEEVAVAVVHDPGCACEGVAGVGHQAGHAHIAGTGVLHAQLQRLVRLVAVVLQHGRTHEEFAVIAKRRRCTAVVCGPGAATPVLQAVGVVGPSQGGSVTQAQGHVRGGHAGDCEHHKG
ncbi:DUF4347 domain-containing protein [Limnohabitans sp.]|uniref:DUF4347 domain-containing protein n=1 Tax=Limnohabitans sp. TaxID=1907725 RepID=UPI003BB171C2